MYDEESRLKKTGYLKARKMLKSQGWGYEKFDPKYKTGEEPHVFKTVENIRFWKNFKCYHLKMKHLEDDP